MMHSKRRLTVMVLLGLALGAAGCEATATREPGVFVPNLEGSYTLTNTNVDFCAAQFDGTAVVNQDEKNFVLHADTSGFSDLFGTVDEFGVITATGATSGAETLTCSGQYAGDFLSGICETQIETCTIDADTGDQVCTTTDVACAFAYEKI